MKDRLVELLKDSRTLDTLYDTEWEEAAEELLASGVIVPPCKVGSRVYQIDDVRVYESTVEEITVTRVSTIFCTEGVAFDEMAIGKSIFLTREEAEKALERSKKGKTFYSPEDVSKMTPEQVRENYSAIMDSMKEWRHG